jgi:hypothetical protein
MVLAVRNLDRNTLDCLQQDLCAYEKDSVLWQAWRHGFLNPGADRFRGNPNEPAFKAGQTERRDFDRRHPGGLPCP